MSNEQPVTWTQLLSFFTPLGTAASLVTLSHVIINSTLARSEHPEVTIASYSIAMSVFVITERPAFLLRQTCSALVRDQLSFRLMSQVTIYLLMGMMGVGLILSFSPAGPWVFSHVFSVEQALVEPIVAVYRVLLFVTIFSAIRCLFHGIIITDLRTKWLTIGMAVRLTAMYLLSLYWIQSPHAIDGKTGAYLFLIGMMIEAGISYWEGRKVARKLPQEKHNHSVRSMSDIFRFYRPLVYSAFIAVIIPLAINATLGKTEGVERAIASYALALSVTHLITSFFSYMHQVVLNFFSKDPLGVIRFAWVAGFVPTLAMGVLGYTSAGPWFLQQVMGVSGELLTATLQALRVLMIMTLVYPWVDFVNGILMLKKQTPVMMVSQIANVGVTLLILFFCVYAVPHWNGVIGALALSLGMVMELTVIGFIAWKSLNTKIFARTKGGMRNS